MHRVISIILMLACFQAFAAKEIQGRLSTRDNLPITIKLGEAFHGRLLLWPIEEQDIKNIKSLIGSTLVDGIYVADINRIERSENNYDLFEVDLELILTEVLKLDSFYVWKYGEYFIPITISNINIDKSSKTQAAEFLIVDQNLTTKNHGIYLTIGAILLLFVVFVIFLLKHLGLRKQALLLKKQKELIKNMWKDKLRQAQTREDYEYLYQHRVEWGEYFPVTQDVIMFFHDLNEIQFKKEWDETDIKFIEKSYSSIRESIDIL